MAVSNTNNSYLSFDGFVFSTFWTDDLGYEPSVDTEDMTAGSGATHVARAAKLKDNKISGAIMYDDSTFSTYAAKLKPGTIGSLVYGPDTNAAGKPCFTGSMLLESVKLSQSVDKKKLAFEVSWVQAAAPTKTIENGDTF